MQFESPPFGAPVAPNLSSLTAKLHFDPDSAHIWLGDRRMMLVHEASIGLLRREVVDALGVEHAHAIYARQGHIAGELDAQIAVKARPQASPYEMLSVGPELHALAGIVLAENLSLDVDIEAGRFHCEYRWTNSSECAAHLAMFGRGVAPAGWSQTGYASGFASTFLGHPIEYREVECIAMGHTSCRIVGRSRDAWETPAPTPRSQGQLPTPIANPAPLIVRGDMQSTAIEGRLVGTSAGFNIALEMTRKVAETQATVLLLGESGVGKEMFARGLHRLSPRRDQPFVAINCAAMADALFDAELFGVEKGTFPGADATRAGKFENASGGTIFLDEVGTLSLAAQAKLLRVLQERAIEPVGATHPRTVDTRVVAATNIDLRAAVARGDFRDDLFFRLNMFPITIPPLRQRRADIPLLISHFLSVCAARYSRDVPQITEDAISALLSYDWPGNVRELENIIERGVILTPPGTPITVHSLFNSGEQLNETRYMLAEDGSVRANDAPVTNNLAEEALRSGLAMDEIEHRILHAALAAHDGNRSRAAAALGMSRAQFNYRTKKNESTTSTA